VMKKWVDSDERSAVGYLIAPKGLQCLADLRVYRI
jgi:hypothetical protein